MLHDLANDDGYVALKRAAEDREVWRHRERMSKPALQQKTTDNKDDDAYWNIVIVSVHGVYVLCGK